MAVNVGEFGELTQGGMANLYHIENEKGSYAEITDFGAILVKLCVPDRDGKLRDVVLGYDQVTAYEENTCFFGATIGRNGNRIANARFKIGGREYVLARNENCNNLHSGPNGFEKKLWSSMAVSENAVRFYRTSPDGENGFPGNFEVSVTYELTEDDELKITYEGSSDADTIANLTNHSYFNLAGEGSGDILSTELMIHAKGFHPVVDEASIPTGEVRPVEGTVMDFCEPKPIGLQIEEPDEQLAFTGGYDHDFAVDGYEPGKIREVAEAYCKESGILMTVTSDCPCVQFYAGNFIKDQKGKNGHIYGKRNGFCLETQVEPNAVNQEGFHSPILKAGEKYLSRTSYHFSVR